jgi:hypothetical protein
MTPVERQRRRRLKLSGGPTARLKREIQRALDDGLTPAEVAALIEAMLEKLRLRAATGRSGPWEVGSGNQCLKR